MSYYELKKSEKQAKSSYVSTLYPFWISRSHHKNNRIIIHSSKEGRIPYTRNTFNYFVVKRFNVFADGHC